MEYFSNDMPEKKWPIRKKCSYNGREQKNPENIHDIAVENWARSSE